MNTEPTQLGQAVTTLRSGRPPKRKTRITIYLDDDVLAQFRNESQQCGMGYQTLINAALRHRIVAQQAERTD